MAANVAKAFNGQDIIRTEVIMTMHEMHYFFGRSNVRRAVSTTLGLLGIAVLGYVAITFVEHTLPSINLSSGFAVESQMASPEPAVGIADTPATSGVATASVPAAPPATSGTPEVGYFPKRYVNQATTIEDQSPTF